MHPWSIDRVMPVLTNRAKAVRKAVRMTATGAACRTSTLGGTGVAIEDATVTAARMKMRATGPAAIAIAGKDGTEVPIVDGRVLS